MEKTSSFGPSAIRIIISCALTIVITLGLSSQAEAQVSAPETIEIEPAFQEIVITENQATASAQLRLTNRTTEAQSFDLTPIDIQQFDRDGNITFSDKPLSGDFNLAGFISLPTASISIEPQSSVEVPIVITNSQALSPGGHYAALMARLRSNSDQEQVILPAVSSFILVRKEGGELYNLSLQGSDLPTSYWWQFPKTVTLHFSNQGNTHLIPRGTIEVRDQFQRLVARSIINENSLYVFPNTQRDLVATLNSVALTLPISLLQVTISGTSQPGNVPYNLTNWVLYLNPVGLVIILALGGGILAMIKVKRHAKTAKKT